MRTVPSGFVKNVLPKFVNWKVVRTFGALQALTRASYAMLVIVPIIAGFWPIYVPVLSAGQGAIGKSTDRVVKIADELRIDSTSLNSAVQAEIEQKLTRRINDLAGEITRVSDHLIKALELLPYHLSPAFGLAFFAALAVAFGQFVYQISAPEIVRRHTLEEYKQEQARLYGETHVSSQVLASIKIIKDKIYSEGPIDSIHIKNLTDCILGVLNCIKEYVEGVISDTPTASTPKQQTIPDPQPLTPLSTPLLPSSLYFGARSLRKGIIAPYPVIAAYPFFRHAPKTKVSVDNAVIRPILYALNWVLVAFGLGRAVDPDLLPRADELYARFKYDKDTPLREFLDTRNSQRRSGAIDNTARRSVAEGEKMRGIIGVARAGLEQHGPFYFREALDLLRDPDDRGRLMYKFATEKDKLFIMDYPEPMIKNLYPPVCWIPDWVGDIDSEDYLIENYFRTADSKSAQLHNRERIWISAEIEYMDQAKHFRYGPCIVAATFYIIALSLIGWITYTQALSVATAVGWLPVGTPPTPP
jgi:hypothetical protein